MREKLQCPKCEGVELFVIDPWQQPDPQYSNTRLSVNVGTFPTPPKGLSRFFSNSARLDVGTFELWVCGGCGFSEFYAKDVTQLRVLAENGTEGVRRIAPA